MLKNYFKIAVRNLYRQKVFTLINAAGLAAGLACCILILLYVQDEIGFDKFHKKNENIYRVIEERTNADGSISIIPLSSGVIGPYAKEDLPQVEEQVRIISRSATGRFTVNRGENKFYSGSHIFTEPEFFKIFDFELIKGDKNLAITDPKTVVLTESAKQKYFGSEDAYGESLSIEGAGDFKITGILKDPLKNSHLTFDLIFSLESLLAIEGWRNWINSAKSDWITTYILLKPNHQIEEVKKHFKKIVDEHFSGTEITTRNISLQPLNDIHFGSGNMESDYLNANSADESYIYILSIIAGFILLIACINFMNLSIVRSLSRAKEVGLRKVMGAFRSNLFGQFLGESVLLAFISLFISIFFIEILLPLFNSLTEKNIVINYLENWEFVLSVAAMTFLVGLISGSYPALFLSRYQPVKVLKGSASQNGKSSFRKILVITQFVLSIVMIISTLMVYDQLEFIQIKSWDFKKII
jgi:putative ABC transport system permease protein